jgi:uncharacterized protein (DUF305 family)
MKRYIFLLSILLASIGFVSLQVVANDPIEGREGRTEVRFLEGMIDHHMMALMMAYDALDNASTEEVKTLAQNMIDAQSAEIAQMQTWLRDWYSIDYMSMMNFSSMDGEQMETAMRGMMAGMMNMGGMGNMGEHSGHNMDAMRSGDMPMMMGMMAGLGIFEGETYDLAWLEAMIDHHDDAIHMSERLQERVPNAHAELLALAQQIIDDQSSEITGMEATIQALESN